MKNDLSNSTIYINSIYPCYIIGTITNIKALKNFEVKYFKNYDNSNMVSIYEIGNLSNGLLYTIELFETIFTFVYYEKSELLFKYCGSNTISKSGKNISTIVYRNELFNLPVYFSFIDPIKLFY